MRMNTEDDQHRARFASAEVARLATVARSGQPHLVPVTFAVVRNLVVMAVDHKPKTTTNLKRLRNIIENDQVSMLVDHYDQDWTNLWWVRADGVGRILDEEVDRREPVAWLQAKYPQYVEAPPTGPVIRVEVHTWRGWSFTG